MYKSYTILSILMISIFLSLPAIAVSPCAAIARACMNNGYYQGGHEAGKGLVLDCVLPVAQKGKTLPGQNFDDATLRKCAALVQEKMNEQQQ